MSTISKIANDDGTFTVLADGQAVRSTRDSAEADDVLRSLSYLVDDEERGRAA